MTEMCSDFAMLGALCPMHIVLSSDGRIVSVGPTLQKVAPLSLLNAQFLDVFEVKRPLGISSLACVKGCAGKKLSVCLNGLSDRALKGVAVRGPQKGQITINLSFGISVVDAVQDFELNASDFAATDLTVEMLYLVEAKSAAMEAFRKLNERLQSAREMAEALALTDTLTGLMNLRGMDQHLSLLVEQKAQFAVLRVDLDLFKAVNDSLGHAVGDFVLQHVSDLMATNTRPEDAVARVGGDEFVILLRNCESRSDVGGVAARIIRDVSAPIPFEGGRCGVSCSIGIVMSQDYETQDTEAMLEDADVALYAAKKAGRAAHIFFSEALRGEVLTGK